MLPVPSLRTVLDTWNAVRTHNVRLFGLLLYTKQHDVIYTYVHEKDGLFALDEMLRDGYNSECAVFVFEPATYRWRVWAEQANHLWCQIYCRPESCPWRTSSTVQIVSNETAETVASTRLSGALKAFSDIVPLYPGDDERSTLRDLLDPPFFGENDAFKVTQSFGLNYEEVPCLILFTDLSQGKDLEDKGYFRLRKVGHKQVADHFQRLFQDRAFSEAARQAGCGAK